MDIKHIIHSHDERSNDTDTSDGWCSTKRKIGYEDTSVKRRKSNDKDSDSESDIFSQASSRRSTASSIPPISCEFDEVSHKGSDGRKSSVSLSQIASQLDFFNHISQNVDQAVNIKNVSFKDSDLPKVDDFALLTEEKESEIRQSLINQVHDKYVQPLLDIVGYKWARKAIPGKGKGSKVFTLKYQCSQQKINQRKYTDRSRQLSNPLKQYDCDSLYLIKYTWSKQVVEITYSHLNHAPYVRLPEEVKEVILDHLDVKASDLYKIILNDDRFTNLQHLIPFSKVQSFWSKERVKKKEVSDKETFKKFFNR